MNPNITANEAALFFLQENQKKKEPDFITNMKLQKLLYYAQGYALALLGRPLFDDPIEKWKHGPVIPNVYHQYKHFKAQPIILFDRQHIDWLEEDAYVMTKVDREKGVYTASELSRQTHEEPPWQNARYDCIIPTGKIQDFFNGILVPYAVNFDLNKIEESINSGFVEVPDFKNFDEYHAWVQRESRKV